MTQLTRFYTWAGWIAVVYLVLLFLVPLLQVVKTSLWVDGQFSIETYRQIVTTDIYTSVLIKTIGIAVISTLVALFVGYTIALFIVNRSKKQQGIWLLLVVSTLFMSLTVRLYGWMIVLGEEGPINRLLHWIGAPVDIPLLFSSISVSIGIIHYVLPFVVLSVYTILKKMEPALLEASTMLGASAWRTFWRVTFPLSLPGVYAAASIAFALSTSTFLVPLMLGGPKDQLLANMAYNSIVNIGDMGMGAALSFVLLILIVFVLMMLGVLERSGQHES